MFDIGWSEIFLIAVIALIVIGPKDLPFAMRTVARFVRKLRGLGQEFHNAVSEVMREAELDELKRKMEAATRTNLADTVRETVDPTGGLVGDFDPDEFADRLKRRVEGGPPSAPATPEPSRPAPSSPPAQQPSDAPSPPPSPPPAAASSPSSQPGDEIDRKAEGKTVER